GLRQPTCSVDLCDVGRQQRIQALACRGSSAVPLKEPAQIDHPDPDELLVDYRWFSFHDNLDLKFIGLLGAHGKHAEQDHPYCQRSHHGLSPCQGGVDYFFTGAAGAAIPPASSSSSGHWPACLRAGSRALNRANCASTAFHCASSKSPLTSCSGR